jgi:hypothetical protein
MFDIGQSPEDEARYFLKVARTVVDLFLHGFAPSSEDA